MSNDMERDMERAFTFSVHLSVVQALAVTSVVEYMLTEPSALTAFLSNVPLDTRPVLVRELRKCYASIATQTRTPMSPLRIPAWLT